MPEPSDTPDDIAVLIRESAVSHVAAEDTVGRARRLREIDGHLDQEAFIAWSRLGWTAMLGPAERGGGLGLSEAVALHEELGKGLAGGPLIHGAHVPMLAAGACTGAAASRVVASIAEGTPYALAFQPSGGALESHATAVRLQEGGSVLRLQGAAHYVPSHGGHLLVAARGPAGLVLYHVDARAPGLRRTTARAADGSHVSSLVFDDVRVADDDLVGRTGEAERALDAALDRGRIIQSALLLGVMRATLARTLDYLKTRKQFGKTIGAFQVLQHRAVDLYVQVELTAAALTHAIALADTAQDPVLLAGAASSAKVRASEAALLVTREAIQMHGAIAYTQEHDIGLFLNQALTQAAALGNAAAHRRRYGLIVARQIAA